jgi:uncharacterized protein YcfL
MAKKKGLMLVVASLLLAGCAAKIDGDFCDLAKPMYFDNAETINWLAENDRWLLQGIVAHNEITATCK